MQQQSQQNVKQLWMNHRKIDEQGLIVPYAKERQFNISECVSSLENLLAKSQAEGLQMHYAHQTSQKQWNASQVETIIYQGYLVGRCPKTNFEESKNTKPGQIKVQYRIVRLQQQKTNSPFPYLLLFALKIDSFNCAICNCDHLFRMYKSSFQAIRTEFVMEVKNKILFMNKYPKYHFEPHSFTSKRQHGLTPFLRLKYEDYESAEYFEKSEEILINCLRMHCLRENFDFEAIRLDDYAQIMGYSEEKKVDVENQFHCLQLSVKVKYICCKCKQRIIWTTKNKVSFKFGIFKLDRSYCAPTKPVFDESPPLAQKCKLKLSDQVARHGNLDRAYFEHEYGIEGDKIDKSLIRQIEEELQLRELLEQIGCWHRQASSYNTPSLVVVSIKIPRMVCTGCQKEKDGLIYISNLINNINTTLTLDITRKARLFCKKKYAPKSP